VAGQLREAENAELNGKGGMSVLKLEAAGSSYMPVPIATLQQTARSSSNENVHLTL